MAFASLQRCAVDLVWTASVPADGEDRIEDCVLRALPALSLDQEIPTLTNALLLGRTVYLVDSAGGSTQSKIRIKDSACRALDT